MSQRLLIAIGCNSYSDTNSFGHLTSAELDAQQVFDTLTKLECGDYSQQHSRLLLSATLAGVQDALRHVLFEVGAVDVLTIFFAGHGVLKKESFFLCLSDSRYDALSATALSLSNLLQMVAEAAPVQANLIIDACESGGLAGDLGAILKHDVLGKGGSPSVTLVAAAASDQSAVETSIGGVATQAVLACVTGAQFVQNSTPNLDLVDIGRAISKTVAELSGQTPFVWGLNLFGAARFCKNPHHKASSDASLQQVAGGATGAQAEAIRTALPKLYRIYEDANQGVDCRALFDVIASVVRADPQNAGGATLFVSRLQSALREQLKAAEDRFSAIEASTACLVPLAELATPPGPVRQFIRACALDLAGEAERVLSDVTANTETDRYALLGNNGLADLYYLPLRLTKALGWAGASYLLKRSLGETPNPSLLERLGQAIVEDYSTAFRAVSDAQAPYALIALAALRDAKLTALGETLLSLMFNSAIRCGGNISRNDLAPADALTYLRARAENAWADHRGLIAQPSELLLALLAFAQDFSLEETFDIELRSLDHVTLNGFIPTRWEDSGQERIADGVNHTIMIGHHFFTVADVVARLNTIGIATPTEPTTGALALLASLVFPDRAPWFLWSKARVSKALTP